MRVSVLIPVYNGGKYIGQAIESVLAQTYQDFEIIVVDDGSEDETASVVKRYDNVRYVYQTHSGVASARNRALQEAKGDLIDFLDADDLMMPEKLKRQVEYIDSHPECDLVFCRYRNFSDIDEAEMTQDQNQMINSIPYLRLASTLIRARLFEQLGYFNVHYDRCGEDTEWMTGVMAANININHYIEEVLYLRRIHNTNVTIGYRRIVGKECLMLLANAIRRSRRKRSKPC